MQEFSLFFWGTNHLICQWKSNSSGCNCTNSKPQNGKQLAVSEQQHNFCSHFSISSPKTIPVES